MSKTTTHTTEPLKKTHHEIAMELEPTIVELEGGIVKSMAIMRELKGGYFDRCTQKDDIGSLCILYEFDHMGILADIVLDYLLEIERLQKVLEDYIYQD